MKNMYGKELKFPEDIYYSEEFIWVKDLGGNKVQIGISDLGVKAVKKLAHVKIVAKEGAQITKGKPVGHVETSKGVWEIIAPVSGTVAAINPPLTKGNANPIQMDPYGNGWVMEVETADDSEVKALKKGADEDTKAWINEMIEENVPLMDEDEDDDD